MRKRETITIKFSVPSKAAFLKAIDRDKAVKGSITVKQSARAHIKAAVNYWQAKQMGSHPLKDQIRMIGRA